jgi:hypothetical protein
MQVKMPEDIEERLFQAEEFSKYLRKTVISTILPIEKRMTLPIFEENNDIAQSNTYCLVTPEMAQIEKHV